MNASLKQLWASLDETRVFPVSRALIILFLGLLLSRLVASGLARLLQRRASPQAQMITRRAATWIVFGLTFVTALRQLGFDLSVLVGAAGVFTVAIGFASQTSASNLISGLFLIGERPFVVGDVITFGARTGEVVSIDLLSVKLRTFDNLFVRIPNEALLKSEIVNVTYYPIRRIDTVYALAPEAPLDKARSLLLGAAEEIPEILAEPKPLFSINNAEDGSISVMFSVWLSREAPATLRTDLYTRALTAFAAEGVALAAPRPRA